MFLLRNPHRPQGLPEQSGLAKGHILSDPAGPQRLLAHCPAAGATPLKHLPDLARVTDVDAIFIKDESTRMGIGSFKALGAAYAIAMLAAERAGGPEALAQSPKRASILSDRVFACASAGNHGLSVAVGARLLGARAVVYLADTVPEAFAARLLRFGARVVRAGERYEASMAAAEAECEKNGWTLLSDSSWSDYVDLPMRVMEGYLVMAAEAADQIANPPSHVFLQAGVGGFAAAMTAYFRARWGDEPLIVVVEPDTAATLLRSIEVGRPVHASGPKSIMGRLDCKDPSHLALGELARGADYFLTISDDQCLETVAELDLLEVATTPSGAAGLAGLRHIDTHRTTLGLGHESRVLAFVTEGREEPA